MTTKLPQPQQSCTGTTRLCKSMCVLGTCAHFLAIRKVKVQVEYGVELPNITELQNPHHYEHS